VIEYLVPERVETSAIAVIETDREPLESRLDEHSAARPYSECDARTRFCASLDLAARPASKGPEQSKLRSR